MTTATVRVLHDILPADGQWRKAGETVALPADEARALEARGYVDVLSVDGVREVWGACCADHA